MMPWSDLAAISQVIGAVAVVISLLYLSRQIRQNTRAVQMANATTVQNNFQGLARSLYSNQYTVSAVLKGMKADEPQSPADQLAAYAWFFDMMKTAELAHFHFRHGDLDPALWQASLAFYRAYFDTPGMRGWRARRSAFVPDSRRRWMRAGESRSDGRTPGWRAP